MTREVNASAGKADALVAAVEGQGQRHDIWPSWQ